MSITPNILMGRYEVGFLLGSFTKVYQVKNLEASQIVVVKAVDIEKILKCGMIEKNKG